MREKMILKNEYYIMIILMTAVISVFMYKPCSGKNYGYDLSIHVSACTDERKSISGSETARGTGEKKSVMNPEDETGKNRAENNTKVVKKKRKSESNNISESAGGNPAEGITGKSKFKKRDIRTCNNLNTVKKDRRMITKIKDEINVKNGLKAADISSSGNAKPCGRKIVMIKPVKYKALKNMKKNHGIISEKAAAFRIIRSKKGRLITEETLQDHNKENGEKGHKGVKKRKSWLMFDTLKQAEKAPDIHIIKYRSGRNGKFIKERIKKRRIRKISMRERKVSKRDRGKNKKRKTYTYLVEYNPE